MDERIKPVKRELEQATRAIDVFETLEEIIKLYETAIRELY